MQRSGHNEATEDNATARHEVFMTTEMPPWLRPNHERFATWLVVVAFAGFVAAYSSVLLTFDTVQMSDEGLWEIRSEVVFVRFWWAWIAAGPVLAFASLATAGVTLSVLSDEARQARAGWFAAKTGVTRLLVAALLSVVTVPIAMFAMWIGWLQRTVVPSNTWQFIAGLTVGEWVLGGIGGLMLFLAYRYISWRWPEAFADFNEAE